MEFILQKTWSKEKRISNRIMCLNFNGGLVRNVPVVISTFARVSVWPDYIFYVYDTDL